MKKKQKNQLIWAGAAVVVAVLVGFLMLKDQQPGKLDGFASCLKEKGVKFYGAFWCPHCKAQKEIFGNSKRLLPYIECSTPDTKSQTIECQKASIESYPTWEFADGTREVGELELQHLAEKTGCELPQ